MTRGGVIMPVIDLRCGIGRTCGNKTLDTLHWWLLADDTWKISQKLQNYFNILFGITMRNYQQSTNKPILFQ